MRTTKLTTLAMLLATILMGHGAANAKAIQSDPQELAGITAPDAIDLNSVTLEELMTLPGIGESKARAILEYRTEKGYFHEVDQLTEVRGIGEKLLAKVRDKVKVVQR